MELQTSIARPLSNSKNAIGNVETKNYENYTPILGPSLNMIICSFIGEKHNFFSKFCYGYREIRREGMKKEMDVFLC